MAQVWIGNAAGFGLGTYLREALRPVRYFLDVTGIHERRSKKILADLATKLKSSESSITLEIPVAAGRGGSGGTVAAAAAAGTGGAAAATGLEGVAASQPTLNWETAKIIWKEGGALLRLEGVPPNVPFQSVENYVRRRLGETVTEGVAGEVLNPKVIRGTGFTEDMHLAYPTRKLRVLVQPVPLGVSLSRSQQMFPIKVTSLAAPEERLYEIFRRYGRIRSIEPLPIVGPGAAPAGTGFVVNFAKTVRAIDAKMALNGAVVEGAPSSVLLVGYQKIALSPFLGKVWSSVTGSRFALPAFLIGTSLAMFFLINPIRIFNVTQTLAMNWTDPTSHHSKAVEEAFPWIEREDEKILAERFNSLPSTVLLVHGEPGSGKTAVLEKLLSSRRFAARIDCTKLHAGALDEFTIIDKMGSAFGFTPSFSSLNTVMSYVESAMLIKQSPVSTTRETQLNTLLETLKQALRMMATLYPRNEAKSYSYTTIVFDGFEELIKSIENNTKERSEFILDKIFEFAREVTVVSFLCFRWLSGYQDPSLTGPSR